MARSILASVGRNGVNRPDDVHTVQELLNNVPPDSGGPQPELVVDGKVGPKTISAIQSFQLHHFGWSIADGRIDPGGTTLAKLNEFDSAPTPVVIPVPENLSLIITGSVGIECVNDPTDVWLIQRLLDSLSQDLGGPAARLAIDANIELPTINAIKGFQAFADLPVTGRIVPGDATLVSLVNIIFGMGCCSLGRPQPVVEAALYSPITQDGYFFRGDSDIHYDPNRDIAEPYHERRIKLHWKIPFEDGIDAAIWWPPKQRAYFFRGDEYIRYNLWMDAIDGDYPQKISKYWGKLWDEDIDAALWWPFNPASTLGPAEAGVAYFFKGDEYVKFDPALGNDGNVVDGYPMKIEKGWPGVWPSGINAAIWWPPTQSAYFFKDDRYIRWDRADKSLGPDGGVPKYYPLPIRKHWHGLDQFCVWASHSKAQLKPCQDARPGGKSGGPEYPNGEKIGSNWAQGGWDLGLQFTTLTDLVDQLVRDPVEVPDHKGSGRIARGQITRLALEAHGDTGGVWEVPNQLNGEPYLHDGNLDKYKPLFTQLGEALAPKGVLIFAGCLIAGGGSTGPDLLRRISNFLPGRTIVGFRTIQHIGGTRMRSGKGCTEVGIKDTPYFGRGDADAHGKEWESWPWCSEFSPSAVLAQDGRLIRRAR